MPLYEYDEGTSRKFYRIDLDGRRVLLNWGRIGTEGQHQILNFDTELEARREYERQCEKRTQDRQYSRVHDEAAPRDPEEVERERLAKLAPLSENPRFLFTRKRKFMWVEARGDVLMSAQGLRADEAKLVPLSKKMASPEAALRARDQVVAKLLAEGYELETFGKREKSKRAAKPKLVDCSELERVIERDPFDEASWSVLEDFLLQHEHDPRAELIRLHKANLRGEEAQARGTILPLLLGKKHESLTYALSEPGWRAGYLVDTEIYLGSRGAKSMLAAFLGAPAARLLRELEIRTGPLASLDQLCAVIAQAPCARSLRRLKFAQDRNVVEPTPLDCEMLAGLGLVELDTGQMPIFAPRVLPTLAKLHSRAMSRHQLEHLLEGSLPALRLLALDLRPREAWQPPSAEWLRDITEVLARVANGELAPRLETVQIHVGDEAAAGVVREVLRDGAVTRSCELTIR